MKICVTFYSGYSNLVLRLYSSSCSLVLRGLRCELFWNPDASRCTCAACSFLPIIFNRYHFNCMWLLLHYQSFLSSGLVGMKRLWKVLSNAKKCGEAGDRNLGLPHVIVTEDENFGGCKAGALPLSHIPNIFDIIAMDKPYTYSNFLTSLSRQCNEYYHS